MRTWYAFAALTALGLSVGLTADLALSASAQQQAETTGGTLRVHMIALRSDEGLVGCLLFGRAAGFPGEPDRALQKVQGHFGNSNRRTATCTFRNVPQGTYAVAVGHDENGNQQMDRNMLGIPLEGWGTSNDAPARLGPPSYEDADFEFNGRRQLILVRMRYGI